MTKRQGNVWLEQPSDELEPNHDLDLQFFAAEDEGRTEEPTEKKKEEAREEGQVPQTQELLHALVMGSGFLIIWTMGLWYYQELFYFSKEIISMDRYESLHLGNIQQLINDIIWVIAKIVAPVGGTAFLVSILGTWAQTGPMFSFKALSFDLSNCKFSFETLIEQTLFSKKMLWEFTKSLVKVFVVGGVAVQVIYSNYEEILILIHTPLLEAVEYMLYLVFEIVAKAVLLLLIFSPIDYAFELYDHLDDLKMTPHEVKDERKQQEGDPEIQKKQKEKMREQSEQRMSEEVPEADVVITNPIHYAVALKFEESTMEAPEVVSKGQDFKAQRLKQLAKEHNVPIYEVPLLARALHQLDLGAEIPRVLYESVATVLSWVHKQKDNVSRQETAQLEQQVKETEFAPAS